jgi:PIN domain nuclease of toxin-antitoxin system
MGRFLEEGNRCMIFLDTHVLIWLYQKEREKFTPQGLALLESENLVCSPAVNLELQYLYEIGRITEQSRSILEYLGKKTGLRTDDAGFSGIVLEALEHSWTRDPFDRLITAHAALKSAALLSRDETILKHYSRAVW